MNHVYCTELNLFDISDDVFHEIEQDKNDVWSNESIDHILKLGSGISGGKERIYCFFTGYNFSKADRVKFLKNEYGTGGRSYAFENKNQDKGFINYDSKGLTIHVSSKDSSSLFKDDETKTFSWADVSLRIEKLIAIDNYMSDTELMKYKFKREEDVLPSWLLKRYDIS